MWAATTSSSQKSNNACEAFHSKFNSYFVSTHPNIYKFLKVLKSMQIDTNILIHSSTIEIKKVRKGTKDNIHFITYNFIT